MANAELVAEQTIVDRAYERLEVMRDRAKGLVAGVAVQRVPTPAAAVERDVMTNTGLRRLAHLEIGDEPLVFGRLDLASGETFYIGRVAVHEEGHHPLVVDWRAPVAEAFYRATPGDPMGVVRRRHLICRGQEVVALDDEVLDGDAMPDDLELVGEAALLHALGRSRSGRMRDIVATIQAEQDRVIRTPLEGLLVVQGGPGTGKTAVALHRAAYLLYAHRRRLEDTGVLLLGPNSVFLRYIERVLPSLGEQSVRLDTIAGLVGTEDDDAQDDLAASRVKGDGRMVEVLRQAVDTFTGGLSEPLRILYDDELVELSPAASERVIDVARQAEGTHNEGRALVGRLVLRALWESYGREKRRSIKRGDRGPEIRTGTGHRKAEREAFFEAALDTDRVGAAIDEMWPPLRPREVLSAVLGSRERLETAAEGVLGDDERDALVGSYTRSAADAPLLDELRVLLGPLRRPEPEPEAELEEEEQWMIERMLDDLAETGTQAAAIIRSERGAFAQRYIEARRELDRGRDDDERADYGYILVDEAQDISPMAWRALRRRSRSGWMTIVGDLGQASEASGATAWEDVAEWMSDVPAPEIAELTINYRTPAEIMDVAALLLPAGMEAPTSVRRTGAAPVFTRTTAARLEATIVDAARAEVDREDGTVGVIVPADMVDGVREGLGDLASSDDPLDHPVAVLTLREAKGLEFDSVVVAEPSAVAEGSADGNRAVYVAMSRPTKRLHVVHARALPEPLVGFEGPTGAPSRRSRERR